MKTKSFLCLGTLLSLFLFNLYAGSVENANGIYNVPLTWCADTIKITGNVIVNGTINICPGTYIKFMGNYGIFADQLLAQGTISDSIIFSINDTTGNYNLNSDKGGWKGLLITKNLKMLYCRVEYVKNIREIHNIWLQNPSDSDSTASGYTFELKHSCFRHNFVNNLPNLYNIFLPSDSCYLDIDSNTFEYNRSAAINLNKGFWGPGIQYNKIRNNNGPGIYILSDGKIGPVRGNVIYNNNGSAITVISNDKIGSVTGNAIYNNLGYGIIVGASKGAGKISNNYVCNNHTGIHLENEYASKRVQEISNNIVLNNYQGGGIVVNSCQPIITNNLICNNAGIFGYGTAGGIDLVECSAIIANNTICNNSGMIVGGIFKDRSHANIFNCIIQNNHSETDKAIIEYTFEAGYLSILNDDIVNCDIEGINANDVNGLFINNIDQYPLFVDSVNSDFHLSESSPCINAGLQDTTGLHLPATDLDGNPRIIDLYVDMGAYEYHNDTLKILLQVEGFSAYAGEKRQLRTNSIGGILSYQWQKEGADLLNEKSNTLQFAPIQISDAGYYNCKIFSSGGTISTDTVLVTVSLPNALPNDHSLIELKAYPNPTTGLVFLKFSSGMQGALTISVTDLEGKVLFKKNIDSIEPDLFYPVDLSTLNDGVYILLIDKYPVRIIKNYGR